MNKIVDLANYIVYYILFMKHLSVENQLIKS
jgi:hypothetical protein